MGGFQTTNIYDAAYRVLRSESLSPQKIRLIGLIRQIRLTIFPPARSAVNPWPRALPESAKGASQSFRGCSACPEYRGASFDHFSSCCGHSKRLPSGSEKQISDQHSECRKRNNSPVRFQRIIKTQQGARRENHVHHKAEILPDQAECPALPA